METTSHTRRWYRFSLRTLLVLVTLLCIFCGYLGWAMNWIRQRNEFRRTKGALHGWNMVFENAPPPWSLRPFRERGKDLLQYTLPTDETELMEDSRLFPEAKVCCAEIIRNGIRYHLSADLSDSSLDEGGPYYQNGKLFHGEWYVLIDARD